MKKMILIIILLIITIDVNARTCLPVESENSIYMPVVDIEKYIHDFSNSIVSSKEKEFNKNMMYFYRNTRIKLVIIFDKDYRCSKASNYLKYFDVKNGFSGKYNDLIMLYINPSDKIAEIKVKGNIATSAIYSEDSLENFVENNLDSYNYETTVESFLGEVEYYYNKYNPSNAVDIFSNKDNPSELDEYYKNRKRIHIQVIVISIVLSFIIVYTIILLNRSVTTKNSTYRYLKSNSFRVKRISTKLIKSETINKLRKY